MSNLCVLAASAVEDDKYAGIIAYLSEDDGYWLENDIWDVRDNVFKELTTYVSRSYPQTIVFSGIKETALKNEVKYYLAYALKNKLLSAATIFKNYNLPLRALQAFTEKCKIKSFNGIKISKSRIELFLKANGVNTGGVSGDTYIYYRNLWNGLISFITEYYDEREETEKDIWNADNIPGAKFSAADKSKGIRCINFIEIPGHYKETIKRFIRILITKRSWSYCNEILNYIRYFFKSFYEQGYTDGFFERLNRMDIEKYLIWVSDYHKDHNATYRSKAVSFIRYFIDYIQLGEYPQAPATDVNRLIFEDDIPHRERVADTFEKVKFIPAPVIDQIDAAVYKIEKKEFIPIYILLRESGWRGTDIVNLRYDNCLDYQWNKKENRYVGYLCGEITKTDIPLLKIPVRDEVAEVLKRLIEIAVDMSTEENNPDKYLFNVYEGKKQGSPLSIANFSKAINGLIKAKDIKGADGELHHFRTHSLRHTRAQEYTEQGMPLAMIMQLLGHCSLQMSLHYAKVSKNALYEKWKETEKLELFHINYAFDDKDNVDGGIVKYENIRKNLDVVSVPFGTCFKPSKVFCKQQMKHCLECSSFCSTKENIPEYENEILRVTELIKTSASVGRHEWIEKNQEYLDLLEDVLRRIRSEGIVHKNGNLREER